jgi:hypothetical protein
LDISPAGPIASVTGFAFLLVAVVAPKRGLWAKYRMRTKQRSELLASLNNG